MGRFNPGVDKGNVFGRPIGLGEAPSTDTMAAVMGCGFTQVPVIEYVTWTVNTPLTDSQITSTFGDEIDVLQSPKQGGLAGVDQIDSSFIVNSILQVNMLAVGYGMHFFGEPQSFTQVGNALSPMSATATASPVSPDVWTLNDLQVLGLPTGATYYPAVLEWGYATWEALWHMANAYQFQWVMNQRYLLINELAADTCYFGPYAEAVAAGTSEVAVQQFARQANNRYRAQGGSSEFVPVNARRIGSVNGSPLPSGATGNTGLFHPTRDFDLAPVTHGGLRNQGGLACCQPFRKLIRPVLLEQGIPIGMKLVVQDAVHQAQMQRYLSISEAQGGTLANVLFDANDTGTSAASSGAGVPAMPELTLDQGANQFANQRVTTSRVIMKGGVLKLAILIKGFEVWGPWKDAIIRNMSSYVNVGGAGGTMAGLPIAPGR